MERDCIDRVRMYNDFDFIPYNGGNLYRLESEGGYTDVVNRFFEPGIVVNIVDVNTPYYTNQDRIGDMDYLMVNLAVLGRNNYKIGKTMDCRAYGTAVVQHPIGDRCHYYCPNKRCKRVVIGVKKDEFVLSLKDGQEIIYTVLKDIEQRYRADTRTSFLLNSRMMLDALIIEDIVMRKGQE